MNLLKLYKLKSTNGSISGGKILTILKLNSQADISGKTAKP